MNIHASQRASDGTVQVWPVIQVSSVGSAVSQAVMAGDSGVDGVFLINHDANHGLLAECITAVHAEMPDLPLGANLIRETPAEALRILHSRFGGPPPLAALWTDDAQLSSALGPARADSLWRQICDEILWYGEHFGGVAFKYQAFVPDAELPALGALAQQWVDVPTTSGPATGQEIALKRLRLLREGLGDHPLALASGVSVENARLLAPYVTHFLVSTSISTEGRLDRAKLEGLLECL